MIYRPARPVDPAAGLRPDALVHGVTAMTTMPTRVIGAKPAAFCRWLFDLLGAAPGDTFDDLFPGSGAVGRAWATFAGRADPSLPSADDVLSPPACDVSLAAADDVSSGPWRDGW